MQVVVLTASLDALLKVREKSSGAESERLKEATNINKSVSTWGISNGKSLHVLYRDSELTFCFWYTTAAD